MSTGRHAGDTASQHQPRTRQQPREVHNPALCSLEAAVPPPSTYQIRQYADVSRWIPGDRPGAGGPAAGTGGGARAETRSALTIRSGPPCGIAAHASDDPDGHRAEHALHTRSHMLGGDRLDLVVPQEPCDPGMMSALGALVMEGSQETANSCQSRIWPPVTSATATRSVQPQRGSTSPSAVIATHTDAASGRHSWQRPMPAGTSHCSMLYRTS